MKGLAHIHTSTSVNELRKGENIAKVSVILKKKKRRFYCGRDLILIKTASIIAPLQTEMVYERCSLNLLDAVSFGVTARNIPNFSFLFLEQYRNVLLGHHGPDLELCSGILKHPFWYISSRHVITWHSTVWYTELSWQATLEIVRKRNTFQKYLTGSVVIKTNLTETKPWPTRHCIGTERRVSLNSRILFVWDHLIQSTPKQGHNLQKVVLRSRQISSTTAPLAGDWMDHPSLLQSVKE